MINTDATLEIPTRFEIIRKLGEGSQKRVWLATDRTSGQKVAISEIPHSDGDPHLAQRLSASLEVQLGTEAHHVAPVYELIERPRGSILVGRYFPTGSLADFLEERSDTQMTLSDVMRITSQVCRALSWTHSLGIVHCDVSSGNLLMSPDGDVFLCDFGLAHRAGVHFPEGIVGGTPAYMAPERMQGDAIQPRSDLYSLGCLLYELITGAPPFVGSQHDESLRRHGLETAAPPSIQRGGVPGWLDDLTLRLLAKDPTQRPVSADDVLMALEGIEVQGSLDERQDRHPGHGGSEIVNREDEISALTDVVREAKAGRSAVAFVLGEAGAGKSRLLDELRRTARAEGVLTLVGHASEDKQLPFEPLAQATRPLAARLGSVPDAAIAAIRQLLAPRSAQTASRRDANPAASPIERAWTLAMRSWSSETPLLLVIDDLHWADSQTLHLIESLATAIAQQVANVPGFALVISSRPVRANHPAHASIQTLQAEQGCQTLVLPSLDLQGVDTLIESHGHPNPAVDLVRYVHENSNGNPLFASTLIRHLQEQEQLQCVEDETKLTLPVSLLELPESLTSAILRRLTALPSSDQQLFSEAACIGMSFARDELENICALESRDAGHTAAIDRCLEANILIEQGDELVFTHSLVRNVLRQLRNQNQQQATHARIARRLIERDSENPETVFRIAHHILQGERHFDPGEAVQWTTAAGDLAFERCAWRDAAELFEAAISLGARDDSHSSVELAFLHRAAGQSRCFAFEADACLDHFNEAIRGFQATEERDEVARTMIERFRAMSQFKKLPSGDATQIDGLESAMKDLSGTDLTLEAQCLAQIAEAHWLAGNSREAKANSTRAVALATELDEAELCGQTLLRRALAQLSNLEVGEALASLRSTISYGERADNPVLVEEALGRMPISLIAMGRLDEALVSIDRAFEANDVVQLPGEAALSHAFLVNIAALRGEHEEVERQAMTALQLGQRAPYPWPAAVFIPSVAYSRSVRGDWSGAIEAIESLSTPGVIFENGSEWAATVARFRAWIALQSGDGLPSEQDIGLADWERPADPRAYDFAIVPGLCCRVELCVEAGLPFEDWIEEALEAAEHNGIVVSAGWPFLVPRARGFAALASQRHEDALEHFQRTRTLADEMGAKFESARARLDCATALSHVGGRIAVERAATEAELAIDSLRENGPGRFFQKAERLLEYLTDRRQ